MILAAGVLVLLGLGLFVGGVVTGLDVLYWACVLACLVAAGLLFGARRQIAAEPPGGTPASADATATDAATTAQEPAPAAAEEAAGEELGDPPVEEVEVTDLLLIVDLKDDVLVIDEHPRYHVEGCVHLRGRTPIPLPMDEARTDGFTPCAVCSPDRTMAERVRARKAAGSS